MMRIFTNRQLPRQRDAVAGFSLIEVLIAVVVLSVGLLALAALQARLARAGAESKNQSVALTLAEEQFENYRSFLDRSGYDAIGNVNPLVENNISVQGASATFNRRTTVTRFVWGCTNPADRSTCDFRQAAVGASDPQVPEYKRVDIRVEWTGAEGVASSVNISNVISSALPSDAALTLREPAQSNLGPRVRIYKPSEAGIIPIAIGNDQAAASSNPKPELTRSGATTVTQFNVQTYLGSDATPLLQRRVDNALINCECRLAGTSTDTNPAYEPAIWDGQRYLSPRAVVGKRVGTVVTSFRQSEGFEEQLCTTCCRDHHDSSTSSVKFKPWRPADDVTGDGNHNHYRFTEGSDGQITFTLAQPGETYHEVCRLVRVDGIFRVTPDTRLENLTVLALDSAGVLPQGTANTYAEFAKRYVEALWNGLSGTWTGGKYLTSEPVLTFPDLLGPGCDANGQNCTWSSLATDPTIPDNSTLSIAEMLDVGKSSIISLPKDATRTLNSRGIYVDYLSDKARSALACIGQPETNLACRTYRNKEPLELIPFLAVNMTGLADWYRDPRPMEVISVRNDGISNSGYERGIVTGIGRIPPGSQFPDGSPRTYVDAVSEATRGNGGLVDRVETSPADQSGKRLHTEQFVSDGQPLPTFRVRIVDSTGTSGSDKFDKNNLSLSITSPSVSPADCERLTGGNKDTHRCRLTSTTVSVTIRMTNYNVPGCPTVNGNNKWTYDPSADICRRAGGETTAPIYTDYEFCRFGALPANTIGSTYNSAPFVTIENPGGQEATSAIVQSVDGSATLVMRGLQNDYRIDAVFAKQGQCAGK